LKQCLATRDDVDKFVVTRAFLWRVCLSNPAIRYGFVEVVRTLVKGLVRVCTVRAVSGVRGHKAGGNVNVQPLTFE
jgi:hypothetical protein